MGGWETYECRVGELLGGDLGDSDGGKCGISAVLRRQSYRLGLSLRDGS